MEERRDKQRKYNTQTLKLHKTKMQTHPLDSEQPSEASLPLER